MTSGIVVAPSLYATAPARIRGVVAAWLAAVLLVGIGGPLLVVGALRSGDVQEALLRPLLLVLPICGALVLNQQPGHPLGWSMIVSGGAQVIGGAITNGHVEAFGSASPHPAALLIGDLMWPLGLPLLAVAVPLFFPYGLPSRRWRPVAALAGAGVAMLLTNSAFTPWSDGWHSGATNPLGVAALAGIGPLLFLLGSLAVGVSALAGVVGLASRWRTAAADERRQVVLLSGTALVGVLAVVIVALADSITDIPKWIDELAPSVLMVGVPIAIAVSVLRRGLFGFDVLFNRVGVYVVTVVGLSIAYAAVVVGLGWTFAGSSSWFPAAAGAALVGIAGQPVLLRVRAEIDRRLRAHADPFDTATALGRELEQAPEPIAIARALCESTRSALGLPWVAVRNTNGAVLARAGSEVRVPTRELPLGSTDSPLGVLVLAMRSPSDDLGERDLEVASHLATQASLALRAASHAAELERERDRSRAVIDADRDRLRRDIHDELAARVTGASYAVRAVSERLHDKDDRALLAQASDDLAASVREMRRLAADVRPHALEELGLVDALRTFARTASASGATVTVAASGDTAALPAAVDVALYRVALEAISNALRHAAASTCEVRLDTMDDRTLLTIQDDGIGGTGPFDNPGTGLRSMARRAAEVGGECDVRPTSAGTIVTMTVPR